MYRIQNENPPKYYVKTELNEKIKTPLISVVI